MGFLTKIQDRLSTVLETKFTDILRDGRPMDLTTLRTCDGDSLSGR